MTAKLITFVAEFAVMAFVWNGFVLVYHRLSRGNWRHSPAGRHVMAMAACLAWNADLVLINVIFPHYPGRFVVQLLSYAAPTIVGVQRFILMVRQLRQEHRTPAPARPASEPPQTLPETLRRPRRP